VTTYLTSERAAWPAGWETCLRREVINEKSICPVVDRS
jgi:hypothetical protein